MSTFKKVLYGLKEATCAAVGTATGAIVTQKVYERTSNVPVSAAAGGAAGVGVYYATSYTSNAVLTAAGIMTPAKGEQSKANKAAKKAEKKAAKEAKKAKKQAIEAAKEAAEDAVNADEAVETLLEYADEQAEQEPEVVAEEVVEEPKAEETQKPAPKKRTRK